jgi:hypothetical protein
MNKPLSPAQRVAMKMIDKSAKPTFTATIFSGSDVIGRINSKTLKALRQHGLIEIASHSTEAIIPGCMIAYIPSEFQLTEQGKAYLTDCAHCYEAPIADNGLYCQPCADKIGKEYMDEWTQRVGVEVQG